MKKMVGLILTVIAVLSGCAQATGEDEFDPEKAMYSSVSHDLSGIVDTEKPNLCLVGDSRTYGVPEGLFSESYDVYNHGVGGTTSYYTANLLKTLAANGEHYDVLIISIGINDRGMGVPIEYSIDFIAESLFYANKIADRVFITTIPGCCPNSGLSSGTVEGASQNAALISSYIPGLAKESGATVILLKEALCGTSLYINRAYDDGSGIHYNAAGYAVIYDLYMSYLGKE